MRTWLANWMICSVLVLIFQGAHLQRPSNFAWQKSEEIGVGIVMPSNWNPGGVPWVAVTNALPLERLISTSSQIIPKALRGSKNSSPILTSYPTFSNLAEFAFWTQSNMFSFFSSIPQKICGVTHLTLFDVIRGPLFAVNGVHCTMIRFCWAHNVHLGLFHRSNAGALLLGQVKDTTARLWICNPTERQMKFSRLGYRLCEVTLRKFGEPRLHLYNAGVWGDVSFEQALRRATRDFKLWKKTNRISCSQPSFRASSVSRLNYWRCSHMTCCEHDSNTRPMAAASLRYLMDRKPYGPWRHTTAGLFAAGCQKNAWSCLAVSNPEKTWWWQHACHVLRNIQTWNYHVRKKPFLFNLQSWHQGPLHMVGSGMIRCAANGMQTKMEAAGRYLCLCWKIKCVHVPASNFTQSYVHV